MPYLNRRNNVKIIIPLLLLAGAASAQQTTTYDLDVSMQIGAASPLVYQGSFTYIGPSEGPVMTNVSVSDALDPGGSFNQGRVDPLSGAVILYDFEGSNSAPIELTFTTNVPLGTPGVQLTSFGVDPNVGWGALCGSGDAFAHACPVESLTARATAAPELDFSSAVAPMTILAGLTLVLKGRKSF
jgi:hypothetical protein